MLAVRKKNWKSSSTYSNCQAGAKEFLCIITSTSISFHNTQQHTTRICELSQHHHGEVRKICQSKCAIGVFSFLDSIARTASWQLDELLRYT